MYFLSLKKATQISTFLKGVWQWALYLCSLWGFLCFLDFHSHHPPVRLHWWKKKKKKKKLGLWQISGGLFSLLWSAVIIFVGVEVSGPPRGAYCTRLTPCHKIKLQGKEKISYNNRGGSYNQRVAKLNLKEEKKIPHGKYIRGMMDGGRGLQIKRRLMSF